MDHLIAAFVHVLQPMSLFWVFLGVTLGLIVAAIPGLGSSMLITLTLPLTFYMPSVDALTLLTAMYVGGVSGGLVSATLLRIPGAPPAIMTTLDGYPMARDGRPGRALGFGITASFVGGLISWIFLVTLSPPLARLATNFGPWEYFTMVCMAMVLIATISQGSLLKGLLSGLLGMLVAMPGSDAASGLIRLNFDIELLENGFSLLPVLIGAFAVSQILSEITRIDEKREGIKVTRKGIFLTLADWKHQAFNMIRSSLLGTWVGILPGIGGSIGSILAYTTAKNMSKTPEKFGTGFEDGVVASESANNATIGGALIPLVTMGIPGSVTDAFLIGALLIHNLQPGPLLFHTNPDVIYGIMVAMLVGQIMMFVIMIGAVTHIAKLMYVPREFLMPVIFVFCVVGTFALHNQIFDVWVMIGFGIVGYLMARGKYPIGPFVIGFILAPIAETEFRAGLMSSGGSYWPLVTRPISVSFLIVGMALLLWPLYRDWRRRRRLA